MTAGRFHDGGSRGASRSSYTVPRDLLEMLFRCDDVSARNDPLIMHARYGIAQMHGVLDPPPAIGYSRPRTARSGMRRR
jgi:hypothetical protein